MDIFHMYIHITEFCSIKRKKIQLDPSNWIPSGTTVRQSGRTFSIIDSDSRRKILWGNSSRIERLVYLEVAIYLGRSARLMDVSIGSSATNVRFGPSVNELVHFYVYVLWQTTGYRAIRQWTSERTSSSSHRH